MFDGLPRVYELINHIVSLGLDISWRRKAASLAAAKGGAAWLDVSTGTGEMAAYLRRLSGAGTTVVATDFSMPMLMEARRKKEAQRILFAIADTGCLPFKPNSFDLVTISLATRNITTSREDLVSCLREFNRILKPGGWFVNLETSQPNSPTARRLFHKYVDGFLRPLGAVISGSKSAYAYLSNTIRGFYEADELTRIIGEAGFETVTVARLFLGVAAIHEAQKTRP
jgi:demethylmenaquinone methyltransferase/2-methoxy-6-polyprenyl-1,4-benzoquinol methylase